MDINSFVTGFSMGKKKGGSGGGSAVLTELTVTENGVYDEPVIEGDKTITWDGVIGDRTVIVQDQEKGIVLVKVSDRILTATDLLGSVAVISMGMTMTITEDMLEVYPEATFVNFTIISISDAETFGAPETGTYFLHMGGDYVQSLTLASAPSTPADGWSKVTVNVAGDIIDVPELPTENIEEGKIYRVTKETEESAIIYAVNVQDPNTGMVSNGDFLKNAASVMEQMGFTVTMKLYVVDSLPEEFEAPIRDLTNRIMEVISYVVRETGEPYSINAVGNVGEAVSMSENAGYPYHGIISDPSEATEDGFYTIMIPAESSTTYGIPNAHPVKRLVDGEWIELT